MLIKTCQRFRARRAACEATWAGELRRSGIPVYFVEGGHKHYTRDGDVLQTCSGDDYDSNSFKLRDGLWMVRDAEPWAEHVFICDDDTFVHPKRWLDYVPEGPFVGLNSDKISWVHGGAGWYVSRKASELYVAEVKRRFSGDDVLMSEILTRNRIPLINRPDLFSQWTDRVSPENTLITCHEVRPEEMATLYAANA